MPKIKNMGHSTVRFNEGVIISGSAGSDNKALVVTGSMVISGSESKPAIDMYANVSGQYVAIIDNDNGSSGHGLKVTTDGTGTGTNILALEAASTTVFKVRGDGRVGIGVDTPGSTLSVDDEIAVGEKLIHRGDPNTYLQFPADDQLNLVAGSRSIFKFDGSTILLNNSNQNYNTQIMADNGNVVFHVDAADVKVGISETNPSYKLDVNGNIGLNEYIYHRGDANTFIRFEDDEINIECGGRQMIQCLESSNDKVCINNNGVDIDFQVKGTSSENNLLRVTAGNNRVGIKTSTPIAELDVSGSIAITSESTTPSQPADGQGYLYTKSDGKLYWRSYDVSETDLTSGAGGGGSTNAAGSDGQIQYNNGGTNFGGAAQLHYDDSNDRLGIGISAPEQSLHVQDGNILLQHNANNQFSTELQFTKSRHATDGSQTVVQTGDILGEIIFKGSDGDEFVTAGAITGKVGYTTPGNNDMPGNIIFSTTPDGSASLTEALRIDQSQGVVVKNGSLTVMGFSNGVEISGLDSGANSYNGMSFSYGAFAPGRAGIVIRGQNSNTVGTLQVRIEQDDTGSPNDVLIIGISGNATFSGTVTENSDARIKTNIRDLPNDTLSKVLQLRPVQFNRINQPNDNEDTSKEYMGFIAQEVETIFPDAVHTRSNDPDNVFGDIQDLKSIANKELIAVLTKAIQEQQEKIQALEARITALES